VIITAQPGMGKSTELTKVANKLKEINPSCWVLRVNLIDCSSIFAAQINPFDHTEAMVFLHKHLSNSTDENIRFLEKEWFQKCLEQGEVIILFDGFDEISPDYNAKVIELLKVLKDSKVKQLWITTRPYGIREELENELVTLSHSLSPFSIFDKKKMMVNLWKDHFDQTLAEENACKLIVRFSESTKDWKSEFFGNPLLLRMISIVFLKAVQSNDTSMTNTLLTDDFGEIDLSELYRTFFDILFDEHLKEKDRGLYDNKDKPSYIKIINTMRMEIEENYKKLALFTLFGEVKFKKLLPGEFEKLQTIIEEINAGSHKMGTIERVIDNKPIFVHRTFAEYFVALLFAETYSTNFEIQNFLRFNIMEEDNLVIFKFLSSIWAKHDKF
jgi:predicted NACHT family NTPase